MGSLGQGLVAQVGEDISLGHPLAGSRAGTLIRALCLCVAHGASLHPFLSIFHPRSLAGLSHPQALPTLTAQGQVGSRAHYRSIREGGRRARKPRGVSGVGGFPRPYSLAPLDDSRPQGPPAHPALPGVPCLSLLFPRAFHTFLVPRPLYPHLSCEHRWGPLSWHSFSQCHSRLTRHCNELHTPASSRRRVKNRLASPAPGDTCTSSSPQQHRFLNQEREQLWVGAGESLRVLSPAWSAPRGPGPLSSHSAASLGRVPTGPGDPWL